ncbi:S41 family peptidase [Isoalcanivorax beigongshangi]|uniref:S41 family peptidase n=1 Tax=Isoalcanivorax beigongshangi TaxID=3238810 RepID=A0ABV4AJD6_9GAMM
MKYILGISLLALATTTVAAPLDPRPQLDQDARQHDIPVTELRRFAEVLERIRVAYVEDADVRELLESAIRGMLMELDPHSAYLSPDEFDDLQVSTSGEFGGLGMEVTMKDGFVTVVTPMDDTPASRAGIQANDVLLKIDDTLLKGLTLNEAVEMLRGEIGSSVTIQLLREGSGSPKTVTLTRDRIQVRSVRSEMLPDEIGYLRISQFQSNTGREVRRQLEQLLADNPNLAGLVLDLRNNPGGVLTGAIQVSDLFLDDGLIVYTQGRSEDTRLNYAASHGDLLNGKPLAVLVNGGSASASEIVAGALQDHGRALIIGRRTFGKGSVQTVLPLQDDAALKLTTARYYTPNGRSIQADGIHPDIPVSVSKVEWSDDPDSLREADLPHHLQSGADSAPDSAAATGALARRDYELYQALSVLRGIHLSQRRPAP